MTNQFDAYVKNTKTKVAIRLLIAVLLIALVTVLCIFFNPILIIALFFSIFIFFMLLYTNRENHREEKYHFKMDVNANIYYPILLDEEYLEKLTFELNKDVDYPKNINHIVKYVQYMIDNHCMIFIEKNFSLDELLSQLNQLMSNNHIVFKLKKSDITKRDTDIIKCRRGAQVQTDLNDLASIRSILEPNGLELVLFFAPYDGFSKFARIDGYILSIIPISKVDTLKKNQIALANRYHK